MGPLQILKGVAIIVGYNSLAAIEGVVVMDSNGEFLVTSSSLLRLPQSIQSLQQLFWSWYPLKYCSQVFGDMDPPKCEFRGSNQYLRQLARHNRRFSRVNAAERGYFVKNLGN